LEAKVTIFTSAWKYWKQRCDCDLTIGKYVDAISTKMTSVHVGTTVLLNLDTGQVLHSLGLSDALLGKTSHLFKALPSILQVPIGYRECAAHAHTARAIAAVPWSQAHGSEVHVNSSDVLSLLAFERDITGDPGQSLVLVERKHTSLPVEWRVV
jgi:hypothetical protein